MVQRREVLRAGAAAAAAAAGAAPSLAGASPATAAASAPAQVPAQAPAQVPAGAFARVLRVASNIAETGFDPPRVSDQASQRVISHVFESLYTYDPLARPSVLVPLTAAALPEVSADFRRWVIPLQRGILFADHPAFGGRPRELVAQDYVYSFKRFYDPSVRTEHLHWFENAKLLGLDALRARVLKDKTPFPYDVEVPGLRALGSHTLLIELAAPSPRFLQLLTIWFTGAVAREVVEAHADDPMAHPVGTGPFMLAQWRRASRVVLERNPRFREQRFATVGAPADDPAAQAAAQRLAGARAPLLDRVEIDVVEEAQPRWLAFLNGEHDVLTLPPEFAPLAVPGGQIAPFLAKRGVRAERALVPATHHTFLNCTDPDIGGLEPVRVALRRAITLAYDSAEEIRRVHRDQSVPAQTLIPPGCYGYDPALKSEASSASAARANALLDLYGYTDRNGDGWREHPDGRPLLLRMAFTPNSRSRAISELWLKRMKAVGLRIVFEFAPFGELIRKSLAGQVMMWGFSWGAPAPDGDFYLGLAYGPNAGQSNDSRFALPEFDRLYEQQSRLPDGPERLALMRRATRLMLAYAPQIPHSHPLQTDLFQPHVQGPYRHLFNGDWYRWASVGELGVRSLP